MLADADVSLVYTRPLGPRLSTEERCSLLARIMERDTDPFETTLALMGRTLGEAPLSALLASPGYALLMTGRARCSSCCAVPVTPQTSPANVGLLSTRSGRACKTAQRRSSEAFGVCFYVLISAPKPQQLELIN